MSELLDVEVVGRPEKCYAGQWIPLTLVLHRPEGSGSSVIIKNVDCGDREVQLDTELLPGDVEMRPGDSFQLRLPVRVAHPKTISLDRIIVQVGMPGDDPTNDSALSPAQANLEVLPAIGQDIAIQLESLCAYGKNTKVQLTVDHKGTAHFTDLILTLGPANMIHAGKRVMRFATFVPGQREQLEAVVESDTLEVAMTAMAGATPTSARVSLAIEKVRSGTELQRFQFLEPRRLSADQKTLYLVDGKERLLVEAVRAAYPLQGGEKYELVITPPDSAVTDVHLEEIKGVINVRTKERTSDKRSWRFFLDVTGHDLFSKPERLFYTVTRADEILKGEVHLRLGPERGRYLRLAGALGIAVTLQGIGAFFKFLAKPDYSMEEAVSHFNFGSDYQLLFPFCIPLLWVIFRLWDWLQYRLQI